MRIVKIIGGLGNQMFQYAFALSLGKHFPDEKILFDVSLYDNYLLHNGLEIDKVFCLDLPLSTKDEVNSISRHFKNYKLQRLYRKIFKGKKTEIIQPSDSKYVPEVFIRPESTYYEGYWQNHKYFQDYDSEIKKAFSFPECADKRNLDLIQAIDNSDNYVAIHVRRGDYLKHDFYRDICTERYYIEGIKYIESKIKNAHYLILSDDDKWCDTFFSNIFMNESCFTIVNWNTGNQSFRDMEIMTHCTGIILANSSFSWWSAFLNRRDNPVIVAPVKWIKCAQENDRQLEPWHLIK